MVRYLYGIDLNRLYVPVDNQGELPVNWQHIDEIVHNEFDDGKRFGDATLLEPTYNLLKKAYKDKDKLTWFEIAFYGMNKLEEKIRKMKYKVVEKKQTIKSHKKRRNIYGVAKSRDEMGGKTMEDGRVRGLVAGKLKKEYLAIRLKILGYNSVREIKQPLDDSKGYHSLGKIGNDLEHFVNLERASKEETQRYIEENREEIEFILNQEEFLDKVRGIYPDFGLNMKDKVSPEDWELYASVVQRTGDLLTELVVGRHNMDTPLEQSDMISDLIDSPEFANACKIEDEFMKKEYEKFIELAKSRGYDDEEVRETSCAILLASLVRTSQSVSNKKQKYIDSYGEYQKFLSKLSGNTLTIKSEFKPQKDDKVHSLEERD